ncbi:hypothetical protein DFR67_1241 [Williamsia limnetica]|uniref:Integrase catalytic domain-containing protein n=1 Tax=Williamsia limnetica TaxID=882452 RepID=A0A318RSY4_WILLI|nr:IS30 family transposase [Williamsia limnetica]PYE12161.1 hypothetical protein DFR67_1241 [Williamsia limnetica]
MGTPPVPVMKVRTFWQFKADGMSTKVAATRAGFSERYGRYLVTKAGGVIPTSKFPDDFSMRISPETIYQSVYVLPKGELKREVKRLRTGRAVRMPHRQTDVRRQIVPEELLITHRRPDIEDRALPGDWEGDCILGKDGLSQIGTLVDRMTRYAILLHLPNGRTGEETRDAMVAAIGDLPAEMKRSITWDQGSEMRGAYRDIAIAHSLKVLQPTFTVGTRNQRAHQRASAAVLSQGH